jgi:hypothetical protein
MVNPTTIKAVVSVNGKLVVKEGVRVPSLQAGEVHAVGHMSDRAESR